MVFKKRDITYSFFFCFVLNASPSKHMSVSSCKRRRRKRIWWRKIKSKRFENLYKKWNKGKVKLQTIVAEKHIEKKNQIKRTENNEMSLKIYERVYVCIYINLCKDTSKQQKIATSQSWIITIFLNKYTSLTYVFMYVCMYVIKL